ncbi:MAG TPA: enoyl-CoA hydratase-related protein [Thermomicrobiales bacterium]|nr:enoyl-CoA hydratase-related protein [Thermomicrobiales bacterium]
MAVDVSRNGAVATVTLNRPQALNAFDTPQLEHLLAALEALAADRSVRAIVITGAGDKSFAAGADIKEMANLSSDGALAFGKLGHAVMRAAERMPQPVIAAVNGYAFGGGCELALACDIRLASPNALFAQPEVSLGIPPGWGGSQRLPRVVGPGLAAEMIFTGRRVDADEALRIGLVNAVHPLGRLREEASEMAAKIAANSPAAVRAAKRLLSLALGRDQAVGLDTERLTFAATFGTPDQREGMSAFIEKRAAAFDGD